MDTQLRDYTDEIVERVTADEIDRLRVQFARPVRRRVAGPIVAIGVAVLVLLIALPLLFFIADDTVTTTTLTPPTTSTIDAEPAPLPIGEWSWTSLESEEGRVPSGQIFAVNGGLVGLEDTCVPAQPSCPAPADFWWESTDGLSWAQNTLPGSLKGYRLNAVTVDGEAWLIGYSSDTTASSLTVFRRTDGEWVGREVFEGEQEAFTPIATSGVETFVAANLSIGEGGYMSRSRTVGGRFEPIEQPSDGDGSYPWGPSRVMAVVEVPGGIATYVHNRNTERIDTWVYSSADSVWEQASNGFDIVEVPYLRVAGSLGSYVAVVGADTGLWHSADGLTWTRLDGQSQLPDPPYIDRADFGFVATTAERVLVSADGLSWEDVDIPDDFLDALESEGGGTKGYWVAGDKVFASVVTSSERLIWVGQFGTVGDDG